MTAQLKKAIVLVVAGATLTFAAIAIANTQKFATSSTVVTTPVTGTAYNVTYSGKISSPKQACVKNRRVTVGDSEQTLATVHSDSTGAWTTGALPNQAEAIGITKKTLSSNPQHKKVCKQFVKVGGF
jgi:hypothetical protein